MIYVCESKYCHYLFKSERETAVCPDCGKAHLHEADAAERRAYFLQCAAFSLPQEQLG